MVFAINRIYNKILQYVYLGFSVGLKVIEKLFFIGEKTKAVANDSRKKNSAQCRQ